MLRVITVCQWNGTIDFDRFMEDGIQGIYINMDSFFYYYLDCLMKNRKIREYFKIGFQYQLTARSKAEAKKEAYAFYKKICNLHYDLIPKADLQDLFQLQEEERKSLAEAFVQMFSELSGENVIFSDTDEEQTEQIIPDGESKGQCVNWFKRPMDRVEYVTYTTIEGDTISKIANLYHVTVNDVLRVNRDLKPEKITPGQILRIPIDSSRTKKDKFILHSVTETDNMEDIAKKYQTSITALETLNMMKAPYVLCKGQVMKIPFAR